ncbi:MAG: hypothetical protein Kow00104_15730 [Rhodothalassiaceae bacterium]
MSRKNAYVEKAEARIAEWEAELKKLSAQAKDARADTRIEIEKNLERLRSERRRLEEMLDDMRKRSETAFEDLQSGFEEASRKLAESMKAARSRFGL